MTTGATGEATNNSKTDGEEARGGDESKGWSRESGSSDVTSDVELEEAAEEPAPLTALPWGTQESGTSRLRMGTQAGGSGGGKATSGTADSASDVTLLLLLSPLHPSLSSPPAPPLPTSLVALRPLALVHAPLPPAPAADIALRDEDVGNRTGGVVARWLLVGESAPIGKWPSRPRIVVGDGKSRPRFLNLPQQ